MAEGHAEQEPGLVLNPDQPLIGVILEEQGHEVVRYFSEEEAVDASAPAPAAQAALALAGAWDDLDWADIEQELDRIRHASPPSAPLAL